MKTVLQSGSAELLKAFDVLNLPVFVIDGGGTVVTCNESVSRAFGWQRDEMIGLDVGRFLSFESPGSARAALPVVSAPSPCVRKDGSSFHSRIAVIPGIAMFELTEDGLVLAVDHLRGKGRH